MNTSLNPGNACSEAIVLPMILIPEDPGWMKIQQSKVILLRCSYVPLK